MPLPRHPSPLWPGHHPVPLRRLDWWLLGAAYVLAFAVRWSIRDAHPYTAEAAHFMVARNLWDGTSNLHTLGNPTGHTDFSWFFWQRPLLSLLYWPAASLGWDAYRATHIVVAALIPPLAAALLRQLGVEARYAYPAAAVLAVHPTMVPWGVMVLPDSTITVLCLGGLLAMHNGRLVAGAACLLAAAWVKEVAFVMPVALLAVLWWRDEEGQRARLWPLRLGRTSTLMLAVAPLCFLPLAVSLQRPGARFPGFRPGGDLPEEIERLFLLVWLVPVALLGLLRPRTRRLTLVAFAWPAFFLAYTVLTGKAIEVWYNVAPAAFTLLAAAAGLSALGESLPPRRRRAAHALAILVAVLVAIPLVAPDGSAANHAVAAPLSGHGQWNVAQSLAYEHRRDDDLFAVLEAVPASARDAWITLDVDWSLVMYPVSWMAGDVYEEQTQQHVLSDAEVREWARAVERMDATIVHRTGWALAQALEQTYSFCMTRIGDYAALYGPSCPGKAEALVAAYRAQPNRTTVPG